MLRKGIVLAALCLLPAVAQANFEQGNWEFTLGGQAANGNEFDGVTAGANGSLGYFLSDNLEIGVRQSFQYGDIAGDSALSGSTRVALDFHFDLGTVQPFIGANIGYVYGDAVNDTFEAAPEAGVKVFVNSTTFIYVMAEYQFFFDKADDVDNGFEDGQFVYGMGLGVRW